MKHSVGFAMESSRDKGLELGVVICKSCHTVIATLPTNGTKKIYGLCSRAECVNASKEREGKNELSGVSRM